VIWNSLRLGLLTTLIAFLISYPRRLPRWHGPRGALRLFAAGDAVPAACGPVVIVKAFAWTILLRSDVSSNENPDRARHHRRSESGNEFLPRPRADRRRAVKHSFLPLMILPIYANVRFSSIRRYGGGGRHAWRLAGSGHFFFRVDPAVDPLPGIIGRRGAGVFSLSVSAYVGADAPDRRKRYPNALREHDRGKAYLLGARAPASAAAAGVVLLAIAIPRFVALSAPTVTGGPKVMIRAAIIVCWVMAIGLAAVFLLRARCW